MYLTGLVMKYFNESIIPIPRLRREMCDKS